MIPPIKCPHIPDIPPVKVISIEEMVGKIRRATQARRDPNFLIIARCDVFNTVVGDPKEAGIPEEMYGKYVERSKAYAEAGADLMFIRGRTQEDIRILSQVIKKPFLVNLNPWRHITISELKEVGVAIVTTSMPFLFVAIKAMKEAFAKFKETGNIRSLDDMMLPESEYWKLMRIDQYRDIFEKFNIS
ncbi:isocitrate lyase/phosphoenolpyruvate mutase family protein, partial [Thermodesulfobacteriota bacterium]